MAKIELFKYPFGVVPRLYGAFPVRRFDADMGALLNAERILKGGGVLGMFPEGTRSRTGYARRRRTRVQHSSPCARGATILPCAITGTEQLGNPLNLLRKPRITVRIGEPIAVEQVRRPTEAAGERTHAAALRRHTALLPARNTSAPILDPEGGRHTDGGDHPGN